VQGRREQSLDLAAKVDRADELGGAREGVASVLVDDEHRRTRRGLRDRSRRHERAAREPRVEDADVGALADGCGDRRPRVRALGGHGEPRVAHDSPERRALSASACSDQGTPAHGRSLAEPAPGPLVAGCRFSLLGPVDASVGGDAVCLGGPRQRALLARLLVDANRVVSADRLVADLWDEPPRDAQAALQNQVSRLRKAVGARLVTKAPGYLLEVKPGEVDLDRFRALVAEAGAAGDSAERSRLLREADSLFCGPALADVAAPFAAAEAAALEELRLAALEARIDVDLGRGRHVELVAELQTLVARHPLRERLHGRLVVALYRCGRQAEALDAYREARRVLDEELGLEPSPELRELERAILTQDDSLAAAAPDPAAAPVPAVRGRRRAKVALVAAAGALLLGDTATTAYLLLGRPHAVVHVRPVEQVRRGRAAATSPVSAVPAWPPPAASASPGKVK